MTELTVQECDLLEWLSKEDFSQYGECYGKSLDNLVALGLAQVHGHESGWNNNFIAKSISKDNLMFRAVSLTEAGIEEAIRRRRNNRNAS